MGNPGKRIFLTGRPGVGKTTLVQRIVERLPNIAGGFYTHEVREGSRRVGFAFRTFDGREGLLAHVSFDTPWHVGKYRVDVKSFESIAVASLERAIGKPGVLVIDEIGKMELFSKRFAEAVLRALASDNPILAVIQQRKDRLTDAIKRRPDVRVIEVTLSTRDALVDEIVKEFSA